MIYDNVEGYESVQLLRETNYSRILTASKEHKPLILKVSKKSTGSCNDLVKREFSILSQIKHRNIIKVFNYGILKDDRSFFAAEFIKGKPLHKSFNGFSSEFINAILQILDALVYFHDRGYFHGDLKPENILYDSRHKRAVLIDFGFASLKNEWTTPRGTIGYIAPEAIKGQDIDERADLFSLGVIMREIMCQQAATAPDASIRAEVPARIKNEGIPEPIDRIVRRLMAVEPVFRPTAGEVFQTLSAYGVRKNKKIKPIAVSMPLLPFMDVCNLREKLINISGMQGKMFALTGDQGLGKTRLLNELKYQYLLAGINVLHHCSDIKSGFFLNFSAYVNYVPDNKAIDDKYYAFEEAMRLFSKKINSDNKPVAILIDDFHELNGFDQSFLRFLKYSLKELKTFIIATSLPKPEFSEISDEQLQLRPFSHQETEGLLAKMMIGADDTDFSSWLHAVSAGNPLFINEILKYLHEKKMVNYIDNKWVVNPDFRKFCCPKMLHELLDAKLMTLDADSITILHYLSLIDQPIEEAIIFELIAPQNHYRIRALINKNLIKEVRIGNKVSIMLSSGIFKNIIDKKLTHAKKRSLAGKLLPVVEQFASDKTEYSPLLADLASIAYIKNKTNIYAMKAAEVKEKTADLGSTLVYYKKAAAAGLDKSDESCFLLMKIGEIEDKIGNIDSALKAYTLAIKQPLNDDLRLKVLYKTGLSYQTQGQHAKAQDFFRKALKLATDDKTKQAEILNHLSYSMMCLQNHEEAQKRLSESLSLIDKTKEPALYAETKYLTAVLDWHRHEYDKGILTMKQVIESAPNLEKHVSVITFYNLLGLFYQQKNDFDNAERTYSDALRILSSSINIPVLIGILVNLAMINKNQRKYDKAKQFLDKALGQARKIGNKSTIASILASIANIAEVMGQLDRAVEINKDAFQYDPELVVIRQNLAMLYCKKSDFKSAETILGVNEQRSRDISHNMTLAVLHADRNVMDKAKPLVEQSLAALRNADVEIYRKIGCYLKASDIYYNAQCYADCLIIANDALKVVPPDSREYHILKAMAKLCEYLTGKVEKISIADCKELLKESGCVYDWIMLNRMEAEAKCLKNNIENNANFVSDLTNIEEMCKSIGAANELARISKVKEACYRITQQPIPEKSLTVQYLNVFSKIIDAIVDHLGEDSLVDELLDVVLQTTQAERGALFLIDKSKTLLLGCKNIDNETIDDAKRISRSVIMETTKNCEAVIISDALNSPVYQNAKSVIINRIRSILCVPFVLSTGFKGAIYLDSRFIPGLFSQENMSFLNVVGKLIAATIEKSRIFKNLTNDFIMLKTGIMAEWASEYLIGESHAIIEIREMIDKVSQIDSTILITGETGTGKGIVARLVHAKSTRKDKKFVQVNCGGLPDTLFESELFGYKRGAFTGAVSDKTGLFEEAQGGSLLLDEIANTPYNVQGKLLYAIEEKKIRRLGETAERKIDVRLLCATNSDIAQMLMQKSFREDLYYRLSILKIHIPPLRERIIDIPILADYFLKKYALDLKRDIQGFDAKTLKTIISYSWPGNVRELQNTIEGAVILAKHKYIVPEDLKLDFGSRALFTNAEKTLDPANIVNALKLSKNNISFAAKILGITRPTLYKYMKKHNICLS